MKVLVLCLLDLTNLDTLISRAATRLGQVLSSQYNQSSKCFVYCSISMEVLKLLGYEITTQHFFTAQQLLKMAMHW